VQAIQIDRYGGPEVIVRRNVPVPAPAPGHVLIRLAYPIELREAGSLFLTRPRLADHLADARTIQRRAADIFQALLEHDHAERNVQSV